MGSCIPFSERYRRNFERSMGVEEDFLAAAETVKNKINKTLGDDELKEVYAFYKQATEGDISKEKPGIADLRGQAKWDAWNSRKGMSQEDAKQKYISLAAELEKKHG